MTYRLGIELAIMQKTELDIRNILQKPTDKLFDIESFYSEVLVFEYASRLMELIDLDPFANGMFTLFYHEVMNEAHELGEDGYPIYMYNLGLLADGIRKYGEDPFRDLIKEADDLMRSLPAARTMDMSEYFSFWVDDFGNNTEFHRKAEKFAIEMKCTYIFHWDADYYYFDESLDLVKGLPAFTKKYIALYQKMIERIQSLGVAA